MSQPSNPFQSVNGLGALKSTHGFSRFFRNNRLIFSGMILAGIFSCMCMLVYGFAQDAQNGASPAQGIGFTLGMAAFMILLGLFLIFWLLQDWRKNRNYAAALFEGGVAIREHDGSIQSVAWQNIDYLKAIRLKRGGFRNYDIVCQDGRVLVLYHFLDGLNDLVGAVKQRIRFEG